MPTIVPDMDAMYKVLRAVLKEQLHVWVAQTEDGTPYALFTTMQLTESITEQKNLVLYSLNITRPVSRGQLVKDFGQLRRYAESVECRHIIFYATNPRLRRLAQYLDFDTSQTVGIKEV